MLGVVWDRLREKPLRSSTDAMVEPFSTTVEGMSHSQLAPILAPKYAGMSKGTFGLISMETLQMLAPLICGMPGDQKATSPVSIPSTRPAPSATMMEPLAVLTVKFGEPDHDALAGK